jgi:hypothetical protein
LVIDDQAFHPQALHKSLRLLFHVVAGYGAGKKENPLPHTADHSPNRAIGRRLQCSVHLIFDTATERLCAIRARHDKFGFNLSSKFNDHHSYLFQLSSADNDH